MATNCDGAALHVCLLLCAALCVTLPTCRLAPDQAATHPTIRSSVVPRHHLDRALPPSRPTTRCAKSPSAATAPCTMWFQRCMRIPLCPAAALREAHWAASACRRPLRDPQQPSCPSTLGSIICWTRERPCVAVQSCHVRRIAIPQPPTTLPLLLLQPTHDDAHHCCHYRQGPAPGALRERPAGCRPPPRLGPPCFQPVC